MDRYFVFLFWSTVIFFITVFLFQRGFLLKREVLPDRTQCKDTANCNPVPQQYEKAIVIIIDALKYDFAVYDRNISLDEAKPFQNALPVIDRLVQTGRGRLFQSMADPPTTTMQRLKGLTTGSIPTFIDVSSNFASYEIDEDNIIDQLVRSGRRVVFMGDDTWTKLFPNRFTRTFPFPSFDVWDLDTVDNGVTRHLNRELARPDQWDVLIGHYLGVDHAGHKYGPNHAEMRRKLTEMNEVVETVASRMPDDAVLFVMGDHGMTMTGDHGGDSDDELRAALFIYSKRESQEHKSNNKTVVAQVDFVPTFSLLMGLPIPFSNIGKVIYDVFVPNASRQLQYLKVNVDQVFTYLSKYRLSHEKALPPVTFESIENMTSAFKEKRAMRPQEVEEVLKLGTDLLSNAKAMCQSMFVEFDLTQIWMGLTICFLHISLMVVISLDKIFLKKVVNAKLFYNLAGSFVLGTGVCSAMAKSYPNLAENFMFDSLSAIFAVVTLPVCGLTTLWRIRHSIGLVIQNIVNNTDGFSLFHVVLMLLTCAGLFSNSYVVEEANIYLYCVTSSFVIHLLSSTFLLKSRKNVLIGLYMLMIVRCASIYFRCREEQQGYCELTDFHKPLGTLPASVSKSYMHWRFFSTMLAAFLTVILPRSWLEHCGNLNGVAPAVLVTYYLPFAVFVTMICQWATQYLPEEMANDLLPWQHNILAQAVYVMCLVSIVIIVAKPHLVYLPTPNRSRHKLMPKVYGDDVKTYFNLMKANWKQHFGTANSAAEKQIIFGMGTGISAFFVAIGVFLAFLSMLILGDGLCPSMWLAAASMTFYLYLTSTRRLSEAKTVSDLMHVPWTSVIGWNLLEGFFFYGTGHQPTFPTIQWGAAFVGFSGSNYGAAAGLLGVNYWLPALLVGWNTFVSRLWFGAMLPLLVVAPFAIYIMVKPSKEDVGIVQVERDLLADGEKVMVLAEQRKDEARTHLFRLCVKYSLILGVRMLASMLAAAHLRRHLMVWKIFAPRFIFEAVGFLVGLVATMIGYVLFVRVQNSLDAYVENVSKKER